MPAAVITATKPSDIKGALVVSNRQVKFRDITADTGTYTTGGFTLTAAQFNLKHIDFAIANTIATSGTAGATANAVGIRYASDGTSIIVQVYEAAATGLALLEKTSNEAYEANWTFRLMVVGQ